MKNKLRNYIDSLFEDAPKTRKAFDLREELLSNLNDKYDDLISKGCSEEDAYQAAITGIGDVSELINALGTDNIMGDGLSEEDRKKSAMLISVAVMMYILSVIPLFILQNVTGLIIMFAVIAVATGIIVYNSISRPKYRRADETIVEEFKEWKSANNDSVRIRKSISSAMWPLIVVAYFFASFYFDSWAYSWMIFLVGAALQNIIKLIFDLKGK